MSNKNEKNEEYEEEAEVIFINGVDYIHCPVCRELVETYDICSKCRWQNTGETNIDGVLTLLSWQRHESSIKRLVR